MNTHPVEIPGYELEHEIARGGFGIVYQARQTTVRRLVALKVLARDSFTPESLHRFRRECEAMGALSWHPHVVVVHDAGVAPSGSPYLAMELLPAGSLAALIARQGPLDVGRALAFGVQLCAALGTAHEAGIVHRDVKPSNVLVGRLGEAKLADFGIAALQTHWRTQTGVVLGSMPYTAPELVGGAPADERSDLYGLGASLYEVLAGRPAFLVEGENSLAQLISRVLHAPPAALATSVDRRVAALVGRCLAKRPEDRPSSMRELAHELQYLQALFGEAVTEVPVADPYAGVGSTRSLFPSPGVSGSAEVPTPGTSRAAPVPLAAVGQTAGVASSARLDRRRTVVAVVAALGVAAASLLALRVTAGPDAASASGAHATTPTARSSDEVTTAGPAGTGKAGGGDATVPSTAGTGTSTHAEPDAEPATAEPAVDGPEDADADAEPMGSACTAPTAAMADDHGSEPAGAHDDGADDHGTEPAMPSGHATGTGTGVDAGAGDAMAAADATSLAGYRLVGRDGGIFVFGGPHFHGSTQDSGHHHQPETRVVGVASTADGHGYWLVTEQGEVFVFGEARALGSVVEMGVDLERGAVGLARTACGAGYWIAAADGRVFPFGDAPDLEAGAGGSIDDVVAILATPTGRGYWLVSHHGDVVARGDARSFGHAHFDHDTVGGAVTPSGQGYWLFAADGEVAVFGDAEDLGDAHRTTDETTVVGGARTVSGGGYWLFTGDGAVLAFGDAQPYGDLVGTPLNGAIVGGTNLAGQV